MAVRPLEGDLVLEIDLHPPDRRKRDADNALKSLFDSLEHGRAYRDDAQIVEFSVRKRDPAPGGKVLVRIAQRRGSAQVGKSGCGIALHGEPLLGPAAQGSAVHGETGHGSQ
jgi:hypothetical protein